MAGLMNKSFSDMSDEEKSKFFDSMAIKDKLLGMGTFRGSDRKSSGFGEAIDSAIGAPARLGISELQKGNFNLDTVKKVIGQIGRDPKEAPTGYDIASKATDNPYLGTALATAVDAGAQLPVGELAAAGKVLPGLVGKVKDVGKASETAKAIIEAIKTPEQAASLKGADRANYLAALDEVHGPRDQRAKAMGFGDETWYHGGPSDLEKFKPSRSGTYGPGVYVTDSPGAAGQYADRAGGDVYTLKLKNQNPINYDDIGGKHGLAAEMEMDGHSDIGSWLKQNEVSGIEAHGSDTVGKERTVQNPADIRRTDAAFDPRFKDSSNLLAAKSGPSPVGLNTSPNQGQPVAKPAFDPNKPFKPAEDAAVKPPFDPNKEFTPAAGPGLAQTALEHTGNAMSMGYLPQLQAAAEPVTNAIGNFVTGNNVEATPYLDVRDQTTKRLQAQAQANPKTAMASDIGGGLVGALATPVPGLGAGKGVLGAAAAGARGGVIQGLMQNPGDTEGKIDPIQATQRLDNAGSGMLVGGATGAGTALTGKALKAIAGSPESLKAVAQDSAVRGSGAMLKDFRSLEGKGKTAELGQYMLDNGLIKAGDTVDDVAKKAGAARESAGSKLSDLYKKAVGKFKEGPGEVPLFDAGFAPARDKDQILSEVSKAMGNQEGKKSALDRLGKYLDQLAEDHGDITLDPKTTQDVKTELDKVAGWARNPLTKEPATEGAFKEARRIVSKKIDAEIERLGGSDSVKALKQANSDYGNAKQVEQMASDKVSREMANRRVSLTDTIAGGGGVAAGAAAGTLLGGDQQHATGEAIAGGLLAAGANHLGRKYGNGLIASGAKAAAPIAKYSGIPLAAKGAGLLLQNPGLMGRLAVEQKRKENQP